MRKTKELKVPVPKEVIESLRKAKIPEERLVKSMTSFATLEVTANISKLEPKEAFKISEKINKKAWEDIKTSL